MAKIAFLNIYSGVVERGSEVFVYELATRLQKKHKVLVFQSGTANYFHNYRIRQIKIAAEPSKRPKGLIGKFYFDRQSLKILIFTLKCLPEIFKEKVDIVFTLNGGWQTLIVRVITKIIGAKMITTGHAGIGRDDAWNLLFRPDIFVALTSAGAQWAEKLTDDVQVMMIPNGVDLSRFNPQVKPMSVDLISPIVICASALDRYKRVDLTIRAVAKAKKLSLLILGDGEMRGSIDSLGKRLLGKKYLRLVVPYEQIPSYYRCGKVFTLASKTEAFGIAYIEAMACNLPIVTTSDNTRAEIIGDAGILTDVANIDQYARDLMLAAKANFKNRPYIQSLKFSWNKIAQRYLALIENLLVK